MAKSCNQKGKILYLERMLSETTSENPVSMQEILAKLEEQGIRAVVAELSKYASIFILSCFYILS